MTATLDHYKSKLLSELINSCFKGQDGYRTAAGIVEDITLKRLFEIYAQQRTRFAQELMDYLPMGNADFQSDSTSKPVRSGRRSSRHDSIRECLDMDAKIVTLYKEVLAQRTLPSRAHFLISSQLALLQRVHDRLSLMLNECPAIRPAPLAYRISA
jgi:hypothetical protein